MLCNEAEHPPCLCSFPLTPLVLHINNNLSPFSCFQLLLCKMLLRCLHWGASKQAKENANRNTDQSFMGEAIKDQLLPSRKAEDNSSLTLALCSRPCITSYQLLGPHFNPQLHLDLGSRV